MIGDGTLLVNSFADGARGGEAVVEQFGDDDYMVQVDVDLNSAKYSEIWVRYTDSGNGYRVQLDGSGNISLESFENGGATSLDSETYTTSATVTVKIKVNGTSIKAWVDGTLEINTTDSTHSAGGVAFSGSSAKYDNLKIFLDNDASDGFNAGDDLFMDEDFGSKNVTISHDHAGNLIDDGTFVYIYDAWNRLVKVRASADSDITIQTAEFDGLGRRIKKVVSNSGDLDATTVYLCNGSQIMQTFIQQTNSEDGSR